MNKRTLILATAAIVIAGLFALSGFAGIAPRLTQGIIAMTSQIPGADADHDDEKDEHAGHDHSADKEEGAEQDSDEGHEECDGDEPGHDEDEGDDPEDEEDGHEGHDHSADAEEDSSQPDKGEWAKYGIKVAVAGAGTLKNQLHLPGEIKLNEDRIAHIVPRASGIVREVAKSVGDTVSEGDVMAWVESAELSEAKVDYFAKWAELGSCKIELARAEEIQKNTSSFLKFLDDNPSLDGLQKINGSVMGENRSKLVSGYAEYVLAKSTYEREKSLFNKKIGSQEEYLAAENALKKANAEFAAARDSIGFSIERDLLERQRAQQVQEIELLGAERRLHLFGLTGTEIEGLSALANLDGGPGDSAQEEACTNPNCASRKMEQEIELREKPTESLKYEKLGWYPLRAPFSGIVIEKHITLGEKVSDDTDAFTVADLATVWVDLNVYQKDLLAIRKGMGVSISVQENRSSAQGVIQFVSPLVEKETRTALARVILPNADGQWRPGLFVNAIVLTGDEGAPVVIPKAALQNLDGETVVFIEEGEGFKPVPVSVGHDDGANVEIRTGLKSGQRYVVQGAFELKAQIITSGLDPHAGHGH